MAADYEKKKAAMLRARAKVNPHKKRKRHKLVKGKPITKERFLKALEGSHGVKAEIARRLNVIHQSLTNWLHKAGNEDMLLAYQNACESVLDKAEHTVIKFMDDKDNPALALKAATWYLEKKDKAQERGFATKQKLVLEGGDTPIQVETNLVNVDSLLLDVRINLMKALESTSQNTHDPSHQIATKKKRKITRRKKKA